MAESIRTICSTYGEGKRSVKWQRSDIRATTSFCKCTHDTILICEILHLPTVALPRVGEIHLANTKSQLTLIEWGLGHSLRVVLLFKARARLSVVCSQLNAFVRRNKWFGISIYWMCWSSVNILFIIYVNTCHTKMNARAQRNRAQRLANGWTTEGSEFESR
jgi:hypothetical protein